MDDEIGGAAYKISHQMIYGNLMYKGEGENNQNNNFEVYNYLNDTTYKKEEIEAFIIADDILNKINNNYLAFGKAEKGNRSIKYSDFVILMDNSKNFELYKKILEFKGIPTTIMKSGNLTDGEVIVIIKNIVSLIIKIKEDKIDNEFKRLFMSLGRSFIFNIDDNTLFNYFLNKDFKDSLIYKKTKELSNIIDVIPIEDLLDIIIEKYDIYNQLILIGDYKSNILRIEKLKEITSNLVNLNYSVYDYEKYLNDILEDIAIVTGATFYDIDSPLDIKDVKLENLGSAKNVKISKDSTFILRGDSKNDILENNLKIEYSINDNNDDTVKIMTIHASKGLEFNVCYFSGLYSKFNIREAINKFSYDNKYGVIIPYKDDFVCNTIYHNLSYRDYVLENISERIRLLYVALTRAKEKMIFILPQDKSDKEYQISDIIDTNIRSKYSSFASILYSLGSITKEYYKNISLEAIGLTKEYNLLKKDNYETKLNRINDKIVVNEISIEEEHKEEKTFSKNNVHLISAEEQNNLDYGTRMHELLELTNFKNPNYEILSSDERKIIDNFIGKIEVDTATIYKEYEFVYTEDNVTYHGVIDLMLEYDDHIKIIDYKLKNINDSEYLKQLNGYKNYIENLFNKKTNIYLYSIIDNRLQKLD